jgi:hypothetical protein
LQRLSELLESIANPTFTFIRKYCREDIPTTESSLIINFCRILEGLLLSANLSQKSDRQKSNAVDMYLAIAYIWAFSSSLDEPSRNRFDSFAKGVLSKFTKTLPDAHSVFVRC